MIDENLMIFKKLVTSNGEEKFDYKNIFKVLFFASFKFFS